MNITARFFRLLFRMRFFRKHYYGFYKRIFRPAGLFKGQTAVCRYGKHLKIKLDIEEWIQQHIYFLGIYDQKGINFLHNYLREGDVFVDIGANIGSFSLIAAELTGPAGKVHAFEPVPQVFDRLKFNVELNRLKHVELNPVAVHESNGKLKLYVSDLKNLGMSSIYHHDTESGDIVEVQARRLDDYVREKSINKIRLIKIDIEGAEMYALRGMKDTLKRLRPAVLLEVAANVLENSEFNKNDIFTFMEGAGYVPRILNPEGYAVPPEGEEEHTNYVFLPAES